MPKKSICGELYCTNLFKKKSAAEARKILVKTYGGHALSKTVSRDWFRRFNFNDFDDEDKARSSAPKKFKDEKLDAFFDANHIRR